ncbi:MAG: LemA family protein [Ignavibacteriales bacterium]|nr:MAG: LemA family protein [Ignavibacteriales bacterium]
MSFVISAIVILVVFWFVIVYNKFVKDKNLIREAWSGIDVQLKRRNDLIPNLVDAVKSYSGYEKSLFEKITELRNKAASQEQIKEKAHTENDLTKSIVNLLIIAEAYPDLKASTNFLDLQKELADTEDQLQYARRYYNGVVRDYNIRVESFPSNIIANVFRYKTDDYFEIELASERMSPQVKI